jgi:DNA-3-methyladenine glycosylase II
MSELAIAHLSTVDPILGGVIRAVGPSTMIVEPDCAPFQTLAQAIAHQQLNGTAANTILGRFIRSCGTDGLFPTPQAVLAAPEATLRAARFSYAKIASLRDLAEKTLSLVVPDHETLRTLGDEEIITRLTQVRGIGRWTVEMMLMFRLGRPDILPVDDFGVRNGFRLAYGLKKMPSPKALALFGARWAPHRSVAAWFLWRAVELARAGKLPQPLERIRLPRLPRRRRATRSTRNGHASPRASIRRTPRASNGASKGATRSRATPRKARTAAHNARAPIRSNRSRSPAEASRTVPGSLRAAAATARKRAPVAPRKSQAVVPRVRRARSKRARR